MEGGAPRGRDVEASLALFKKINFIISSGKLGFVSYPHWVQRPVPFFLPFDDADGEVCLDPPGLVQHAGVDSLPAAGGVHPERQKKNCFLQK